MARIDKQRGVTSIPKILKTVSTSALVTATNTVVMLYPQTRRFLPLGVSVHTGYLGSSVTTPTFDVRAINLTDGSEDTGLGTFTAQPLVVGSVYYCSTTAGESFYVDNAGTAFDRNDNYRFTLGNNKGWSLITPDSEYNANRAIGVNIAGGSVGTTTAGFIMVSLTLAYEPIDAV